MLHYVTSIISIQIVKSMKTHLIKSLTQEIPHVTIKQICDFMNQLNRKNIQKTDFKGFDDSTRDSLFKAFTQSMNINECSETPQAADVYLIKFLFQKVPQITIKMVYDFLAQAYQMKRVFMSVNANQTIVQRSDFKGFDNLTLDGLCWAMKQVDAQIKLLRTKNKIPTKTPTNNQPKSLTTNFDIELKNTLSIEAPHINNKQIEQYIKDVDIQLSTKVHQLNLNNVPGFDVETLKILSDAMIRILKNYEIIQSDCDCHLGGQEYCLSVNK